MVKKIVVEELLKDYREGVEVLLNSDDPDVRLQGEAMQAGIGVLAWAVEQHNKGTDPQNTRHALLGAMSTITYNIVGGKISAKSADDFLLSQKELATSVYETIKIYEHMMVEYMKIEMGMRSEDAELVRKINYKFREVGDA